MKKIIYFIILLLIVNTRLSAQWINNIQYHPSNPTTTDTISFYVSLIFPSGTCDQHAQGFNINGNKIEAFALHCLGMLTYICNHTDTFKINPLPPGLYSFHFKLDVGMLPFPCSPGTVAGPTDSVTFVVNPVTGIGNSTGHVANVFLQENNLIVEINNMQELFLSIYDLNGKIVRSETFSNGLLRLPLNFLNSGAYFYTLSSGTKIIKEGTFAKQ